MSFFRIPCATTTTPLSIDEYNENRKKYREKYNIANNEVVFIYSGGVSSWQCIEETIALYKGIASKSKTSMRLLVFSHMRETIEKIVRNDKSIIIDSYQPDELEKALCAGDYAFLIRRKSIINEVAFPNKYLEYVKSGMQIITTPYVDEIARQIEKYGIGYIHDLGQPLEPLINYVNCNTIDKNEMIRKSEEILDYNGFKKRLLPFINFIKPQGL